MNEWLVVGSSPSVIETFPFALAEHKGACTITANAGILIFKEYNRWPNYMVMIDQRASEMFRFHVRLAQVEGTRLVTSNWASKAIEEAKLTADVVLNVPEEREYKFYRDRYTDPLLSGLLSCQFAIQGGAKRLVLIGMDGYHDWNWEPKVETFDGRLGDCNGREKTRVVVAPFMQSMLDACPDVEFVQYGKPRYQLTGDNFTLMDPAVKHGELELTR